MTKGWRHFILQFIAIYLSVGFFLSLGTNVLGGATGGPSAFVWTGSLKGNAVLLFWWFIIPAITWPIDLYWTLYHKLF
jgi:hypothetical protein